MTAAAVLFLLSLDPLDLILAAGLFGGQASCLLSSVINNLFFLGFVQTIDDLIDTPLNFDIPELGERNQFRCLAPASIPMYKLVVEKGHLSYVKASLFSKVTCRSIYYLDIVLLVAFDAVGFNQLRTVRDHVLGDSVQGPASLWLQVNMSRA